MRIFITILLAVAVVAVQAAAVSDVPLLKSRALRHQNHDVCLKILDSWWKKREHEKVRHKVVQLDTICSQWSGFKNKDKCNIKSKRKNPSPAEKKASCVMVGAHSYKCEANPCNQYNTGKCTVHETGGQCMWFSKSNMAKVNAHWAKMAATATTQKQKDIYNDRKLPFFGCHRNPCNKPGYKNSPRKLCSSGDFDVPSVFQCTWCNGQGRLKDSGMGCQATTVKTTAQCAHVNGKNLQDSVYYVKGKHHCECSADYTLCSEDVSHSSNLIKKKKK